MKILVSGSRDGFKYEEFVFLFKEALVLSNIKIEDVEEVIAGGAKGIDTFAKRLSKFYNIPFTEMCADWDNLGKSAGIVRNVEMLSYLKSNNNPSDIVFVFRYNVSRGASHMVGIAKSGGFNMYVKDKFDLEF